MLVNKNQFFEDLENNYLELVRLGIRKKDAPYFLPPYEWYNKSISSWTEQAGLTLINFSAGTRSAADYTWPEMGNKYLSSNEIYKSIMNYENSSANGLNGFILLIHLGTDPRRTDKFYEQLNELIPDLKRRGYSFKRIDELLR